MTENQRLESQSIVYPQYISAYPVDDEMSLVDLWISLVKFKNVFIVSFLIILISGILVISVFKSDKYDLNTTISIGQVVKAGAIQVLQTPSSVMSKINLSVLPNLTKQIVLESDIKLFKTKVSNPKNTHLVTIQNRVKESNKAIMIGFQKRIADAIVTEHLALSRILSSELEQALAAEKLALERLKDPRELVKLTDFEKISLQEEKLNLLKLTDANYLQAKKNNFQKRIDLNDSKIKALTEKTRVLKSQLGPQKDTRENSAQRLLVLDKIAEIDLSINEAEGRKTELESKFSDFLIEADLKAAKQQTVVKSLESEIKLIESNWKVAIKEKENKIAELENQLKGNLTRVVSLAELSLEPVGLSRNLAYVLNLLLAFIAAFFVTLVAMFRAKVNEKLAIGT